jgi:hypothetical protein
MILPQGYYKTFFWKNILLMKVTPIHYQTVFSYPQKEGERFNIHSKILKKPFPICFQLRKKVVIFTIVYSLSPQVPEKCLLQALYRTSPLVLDNAIRRLNLKLDLLRL